MSKQRHARFVPVSPEARVSPLELFFDLVFVFSLTQVTALLASDLTGRGLVRGLLVLALLWWSWVGYAWLGNVVQAEEGLGRATMLAAMAAMFVFAIAVPEAFVDGPGGLEGPVVVACAYLTVRLLHLAIFWLAAGQDGDRGLRRQLIRFAPSVFGSTAVLLVASQLVGTAQTLAWFGAVVVDFVGTILAGASGWRLRSASHFAERHGLIVIVAFGESIVAIGVGVAAVPISWPIVAASVLGLSVAATLWWAYFDVVAIAAERSLRQAEGEVQVRLARDAYSYLHLPMIAGIVLLALGIERVLEHVAVETVHALSDPLETFPLLALYGGVALFLGAHVAFKWRAWHRLSVRRLVVAALMLASVPLTARLPALAALGLLAVATATLIATEVISYADEREQIRHEESGARSRNAVPA